MKKIIILAAFLFFALFIAAPAQADSVFIELTFSVTSLRIPKRAAMLNLPLNTEFRLSSGNGIVYYEIENPDGDAELSKHVSRISGSWYYFPYAGEPPLSESSVTEVMTFEHTGSVYTPRIRIRRHSSGTDQALDSCTTYPGTSTYVHLAYWTGSTWAGASCPTPPAASGKGSTISFGSTETDIYIKFDPIIR